MTYQGITTPFKINIKEYVKEKNIKVITHLLGIFFKYLKFKININTR
jgi:hypothetical protein